MEHIPVGLHELPQEERVVRHGRDVDGVRSRVPRIEIVRCSHHRRLLRTVVIQ